MTERSDLATLQALGEPRLHAWAGAPDATAAGLVEWTRLAVAHDQALAVRASLRAFALVTGAYAGPKRAYIDHMIAVIGLWLDDPSREHREAVRSSLDVTRELHAWQREADDASAWILEAVDHTCLTVWAGERSSYIIPVDFATTAGRVIGCAFHAMRSAGQPEPEAADAVMNAVLGG